VLKPDVFAEIIAMIDDSKINFTIASQKLLPALLENPEKEPAKLAAELNLIMERDRNSIANLIRKVLDENPQEVKAYKNGKKALIGMFMGEIMKKSKGKTDPKKANQLLRELLQEE
jgi:aspartyl-tRNA(Asn)/glutamyl-tRNA(Gln) amidotransferase subunit B